MAGCGYTPGAIDAMPIYDVMALLAHWRETPPAHEVLAAVYGIKPAPLPDPRDPSGIGALIASEQNSQMATDPRSTGKGTAKGR